MTALHLLTSIDAADLERLGVYDTAPALIDAAKFDNRPTWDNTKPPFDNRPSWDNWNNKK
ncbi:hypothetical protein DMB66_36515 [Actinoplanes sp. ATCC 53533]|uniref:multiple cyclophane-containing RiPP AmcA n=1 Tax=Actinoplanes sp. ATCC 53533 TaxID=1288362 RepID=UPI000F76D5DE|nr:multiple cyclophane-containing RiPP AmcA [Actinoplanes sp. ATCC 53533]RSM55054.1 hypothetical protein DMB66_36515 [Actinoplanes sp. ATCC 53533]